AIQTLNEIKSTGIYPKSAMLFIEGQQPRGVFVLCTGKAKLSTSSSEGKTIITKISEAGDLLGLNATISNHPYEVTAEMIEPGQARRSAASSPISRRNNCFKGLYIGDPQQINAGKNGSSLVEPNHNLGPGHPAYFLFLLSQDLLVIFGFGFNLVDLLAKPVTQRVLQFQLSAASRVVIDCFGIGAQRNEPAGYVFRLMLFRNKSHEHTVAAGMRPHRVVKV